MKIFYDGIVFLQQKQGGINRVFLEIAGLLPTLKKSVSLCLYRFPDSFNDSFIKQHYYSLPKIGGLLRRLDTLFLMRQVARCSPDIYHTTYYRIPHMVKAKKVITVYDMIHEKFAHYFGNPSAFLLQKKRCLENADGIAAISINTKNDIVQLYNIPPSKIKVTHLAASRMFSPASSQEKDLLKDTFKIEKPFFLYVGQRGLYKNFVALLRAFSLWSRRKDFLLLCIGGKEGWDKSEFQIIESCGLAGAVRLISCSDNELKTFYSMAVAFVYPSLYEGFGIPLLEAMACGTPVIASDIPVFREVAGDAVIYFNPESPDDLVRALESVSGDSGLKKILVEAGFRRLRKFSWENTALQTYALYKGIIDG